MDLHAKIMNLALAPGLSEINTTESEQLAYKRGHRDARHAAADLALRADACINALRVLDARLQKCIKNPNISAKEAYDSFYQKIVEEALGTWDEL